MYVFKGETKKILAKIFLELLVFVRASWCRCARGTMGVYQGAACRVVPCRAVPERVVFVGEGRGPAVPVAWLIDLDLPQSVIYVCGGVTCYILYCVQVVYIFYGWILELCAYDHTFK